MGNIQFSQLTGPLSDADLFDLQYLIEQISPHTNQITRKSSERFLANANNFGIIARDTTKNRIIAMGSLLSKDRLNGVVLYIDNFVTDKEYRCQGIGQKIMNRLLEEAKKLGAYRIDLGTSNPMAEQFYKKFGFEFIADEHVYWLRI